MHVIACAGDGTDRRDLTPQARRELAIEPEFDLSRDGRQVAITWQTTGKDRELDTAILLIDVDSGASRLLGAAREQQHRVAALRARRPHARHRADHALAAARGATDPVADRHRDRRHPHRRDRLRRLAAHRRLERRRQAPLRHGRPRRPRAGLRRRRRRRRGRTHHREAQRRRALGPARAGRRPHRRRAIDVPRAARGVRRAAEGRLAAADPRAPVRFRRSRLGRGRASRGEVHRRRRRAVLRRQADGRRAGIRCCSGSTADRSA